MRTTTDAETGQIEPDWKMFDLSRLMRLRLINAILNDEGFSGERWRSRPYREQRQFYQRHNEGLLGSGRQQQQDSTAATLEAEADAQNGVKLRDSRHSFQIKRALYSYFKPEHFEKRPSAHESYRWPREEVFEHLDRIYAADNSTLEEIEKELRYFDAEYRDDMLFQWRAGHTARWSGRIEPPSGWQWLSIPEHYDVDAMVDTAEGLRRWATYLRSLPFDEAIALDIEGSTHGPNGLQLAQLSTFNKACIVDIAKCHAMPEFTGLMESIYYSKALKCGRSFAPKIRQDRNFIYASLDHDGKDFKELSKFLTGTKYFRCVTTPYLISYVSLRFANPRTLKSFSSTFRKRRTSSWKALHESVTL